MPMVRASLGKAVKKRRQELKITANHLAKAVGVNRSFISRMENHGWLPSLPLMKKIAKELKDKKLLKQYAIEKHPEIVEIIKEL
ncbi:MAG: helix-turn-helix transcriptional regulator [Deltaproteobacteria bacterium]|nr:helix-turn-helix transcriptional regulator [Deltaproteobacteria bacterium]